MSKRQRDGHTMAQVPAKTHNARKARFRFQLHPWLFLRTLPRSFLNPDDTENGAWLVLAIDGDASERCFRRFRAHPMGRRILGERRSLGALLDDRAALRAMPEGSLAHAYLGFIDSEGLSSTGLADIVSPLAHELGDLDDDRRLFDDRMTVMHDLWHVVTGYSRDIFGEIALLAFSHVQLRKPAFGLMAGAAYWLGEYQARGFREIISGARRRAKTASWLPAQNWEALLATPLEQVRDELGVGPPPVYTRHFRVPSGLEAEGEPFAGIA